jgi:acyl carrier protein
MDIENKLRELLLPVLGLDSIQEIKPEAALVKDLDADSIDFVEIIYLIEQNFGVVLKTDEIIVAGVEPDTLFQEGKLTSEGASMINNNLPGSRDRYRPGMTKMDLFSVLSVSDLAHIIKLKKSTVGGT